MYRNELQLEEVLSFYPENYDREMAKYWTEPDVKVGEASLKLTDDHDSLLLAVSKLMSSGHVGLPAAGLPVLRSEGLDDWLQGLGEGRRHRQERGGGQAEGRSHLLLPQGTEWVCWK